jgi:hypothetical protein
MVVLTGLICLCRVPLMSTSLQSFSRDGLTMIEKRVPSHKDALVKTTEDAIQAQATIFSGGSSKKTDDDEEDDEGGA